MCARACTVDVNARLLQQNLERSELAAVERERRQHHRVRVALDGVKGANVRQQRAPELQPLDGRVEVDDVEGLLGAALHLQLHLLQKVLLVYILLEQKQKRMVI